MNVSRTISHLLPLLLLGNVNNLAHLRFRALGLGISPCGIRTTTMERSPNSDNHYTSL